MNINQISYSTIGIKPGLTAHLISNVTRPKLEYGTSTTITLRFKLGSSFTARGSLKFSIGLSHLLEHILARSINEKLKQLKASHFVQGTITEDHLLLYIKDILSPINQQDKFIPYYLYAFLKALSDISEDQILNYVESERRIIINEIGGGRVTSSPHMVLINNLFHSSHLKSSLGGTITSIKKIAAEELIKAAGACVCNLQDIVIQTDLFEDNVVSEIYKQLLRISWESLPQSIFERPPEPLVTFKPTGSIEKDISNQTAYFGIKLPGFTQLRSQYERERIISTTFALTDSELGPVLNRKDKNPSLKSLLRSTTSNYIRAYYCAILIDKFTFFDPWQIKLFKTKCKKLIIDQLAFVKDVPNQEVFLSAAIKESHHLLTRLCLSSCVSNCNFLSILNFLKDWKENAIEDLITEIAEAPLDSTCLVYPNIFGNWE